jgi:hypothetical protein
MRNMLWLTAMESHAPMAHRLPTSRGHVLELIALAALLTRRWWARRVKNNLLADHDRQLMAVPESLTWERAGGFRKRSSPPTMLLSRRAVCNPDNWDTIVELGAFKAIDPIGSAFAECAGTDRRHHANSGELDFTAELGLLRQRRATVSASSSRSRPQGSRTRRRSGQVPSVSSWATTRRNPASNSVISNKSRWF